MDRLSPTWEEELKRLPKELVHLSLEQAVSLKPFTKEEIKWFFDQTGTDDLKMLSIFYGNGKQAKLFKYKQDPKRAGEILQTGWVQLRYKYGSLYNMGESYSSSEKFFLYTN